MTIMMMMYSYNADKTRVIRIVTRSTTTAKCLVL